MTQTPDPNSFEFFGQLIEWLMANVGAIAACLLALLVLIVLISLFDGRRAGDAPGEHSDGSRPDPWRRDEDPPRDS